MRKCFKVPGWLLVVPVALAMVFGVWQLSVALADAPEPNPIAQGQDITSNGPAATMHGDPIHGRAIFIQDCQVCHGVLGTGNVDNPGSDDGTVPPLNPIDKGFLEDSGGDPAVFAKGIDLFVQHGSRPAGDNPKLSMIAWGDQNLLSPNDIADVEAYVMMLNNVFWPDKWAPPADVQANVSKQGDLLKYEFNVNNDCGCDIAELYLRVTLPPGLTYVDSWTVAQGQDPGKWSGSTVEFNNQDDPAIPRGNPAGPWVILARPQGGTIPPVVGQITFTYQDLNGDTLPATAVSAPAVLATPTPAPTAQATEAPATEAAAPAPEATEEPAPAPEVTEAPAPAPAPETASPSTNASDLVAAGQQLFQSNGCAACHGANGEGGLGPNLAGKTEAQILAQVRNPVGGIMPAFSSDKLSDQDVHAIAAFIASLGN